MKPFWRIYYPDSTFDSNKGSPLAAPAFGVQCIVQDCSDEGKHLLSNFDYYWFETFFDDCETEGRWCGGDFLGLIDFLTRTTGVVRFGRRLIPAAFEQILRLAGTDPDFIGGGTWRNEGPISPTPGV